MPTLFSKRSFSIALTAAAIAALVACGGGSDPVATTLSVTPVLGAVYGGTVTVYSSTGTLLGTATTRKSDVESTSARPSSPLRTSS